MPNLATASAKVTVCFADVGWTAAAADVKNVWVGKASLPRVVSGSYSATVDVHDTLYVILSAAATADSLA
jgi:hypothetical protein